MRRADRLPKRIRAAACFRRGVWVLALLAAPGCEKKSKVAPSVTEPPELHVMYPRLRTLSRVVGQPSFVQSYERTSVYPKVTAYIEKWNVDIGDKVKKGDVVADLFVPELREEWETKKATVKLDKERVELALKVVKVAEADVKAAEARVAEAQRMLAAYKAEVDRWQSEVNRLDREVRRNVVAPQILLESQKQLECNIARWDAQRATVAKAEAELLAKIAALEEDIVNVAVARARVAVAQSEAKRLEAWVGYLKLFAPYDGIIVGRVANTGDFLLPQTGDPTSMVRAPNLSPGDKAAPVYVIDRTDIVRVFVDVPERDATHIKIGTRARVKIWAYRDEWMPATVTRYAWALNTQSRTMRVEIDLPNPGANILPGMYAYGKVIVERPGVLALPKSAFSYAGGKAYIWRYEDGHAKRTEVQTGVTQGKWIEVTNRHVKTKSEDEEHWAPMDGSVQVLVGPKLSTLTEGAAVRLSSEPPPEEETSQQESNNAM